MSEILHLSGAKRALHSNHVRYEAWWLMDGTPQPYGHSFGKVPGLLLMNGLNWCVCLNHVLKRAAWNSKANQFFMVGYQLDDEPTSLDGKWLEITKHPLKTGCLEFQVIFKCGRSNATTEMTQ